MHFSNRCHLSLCSHWSDPARQWLIKEPVFSAHSTNSLIINGFLNILFYILFLCQFIVLSSSVIDNNVYYYPLHCCSTSWYDYRCYIWISLHQQYCNYKYVSLRSTIVGKSFKLFWKPLICRRCVQNLSWKNIISETLD